MPKGGGAIRGIGEKFSTNPATGAGLLSIPVATSPGRGNIAPLLSLDYDSGSGNGPFGIGWHLRTSSVSRKTSPGLPQYEDDRDSDVFVLSNADDLVPVLTRQGDGWAPPDLPDRTIGGRTFRVRRYRPRVEGLFARIERWSDTNDPTEVFWRSISRDNTTTWYGRTPESRVVDPLDARRIFSWLACETYDPFGNVMTYGYQAEDSRSLLEEHGLVAAAHEGHRTVAGRSAHRYLKRIRYGNRTPYFPVLSDDQDWPSPPGANQTAGSEAPSWRFEVVLDYGDHEERAPTPASDHDWPVRPDPFSTYRAGFEDRTYRRCRRVLMFHHFPEQADVGLSCLVRSTDFEYADTATGYSFIRAVTQRAYRRRGQEYDVDQLPPVELGYSVPQVDQTVHELVPDEGGFLPPAVDGGELRWTDLHGDGAPGVLMEQNGAWLYARNLSPGSGAGAGVAAATLAPFDTVPVKPVADLSQDAQLVDLTGDAVPDVVVDGESLAGYHEHDAAESWLPFVATPSRLTRDLRHPRTHRVDLDGDGQAEVLVFEDEALVYHPSLGSEGFGPARRLPLPADEAAGPRVAFSDATECVHFADLSGDGLPDICRIRNGEVCYWPNLGYGRFGAKVTMDSSPWLDHPDRFDARRARLADVDGSGTADLVYLHPDGVRVFLNQSGNSWLRQPDLIALETHDHATIDVLDLLGTGTACLVWSSPLPHDERRQLRYVDLMGGTKPHLMTRMTNNLGAEVRWTYAPSTRFSVLDRQAGSPWVTRLPFPVHVVERVTTFDHVSRSRFTTRFAYHHGSYDGEEREFAGFAMVEQWDTEVFEDLVAAGSALNVSGESHVPPVHTKTWFHTGAPAAPGDPISRGLEAEYFREPDDSEAAAATRLLDDTVLPDWLSASERREACRALRGRLLRQEVYALDGRGRTDRYPSGLPYTVVEENAAVRLLQPRGIHRHAVFLVCASESLHYDYERSGGDPRCRHDLTLDVDDFGNVLEHASVAYGRRSPDAALPSDDDRRRQTDAIATYQLETFTGAVDALPDSYRSPMPSRSQTFELSEARPDGTRFTVAGLRGLARRTEPVKRLVRHSRTLYRKDDLTDLLPQDVLESLALTGQTFQLALSPELVEEVYGGRVSAEMLREGGHVEEDGWWVPSRRSFFSVETGADPATELEEARRHFFMVRRYRDPFGHDTLVDHRLDLLVARTTDAVGNTVRVDSHDLRLLKPTLVSDPNHNQTAIAHDVLGLVVGTAVMGAPGEGLGDTLTGFVADLTPDQRDEILAKPRLPGDGPRSEASPVVMELLAGATSRMVYDADRFRRTGDPAFVLTVERETHVSDLEPGEETKVRVALSYCDGFGREIQRKIQAEPGPVGGDEPALADPRWVGSGWTVFDNKGNRVRIFEPFFTGDHGFELDARHGTSSVVFHDPVGRPVLTVNADHSYEKTVHGAWQTSTYDANDTCAPQGMETGDPRTDPHFAGLVAAYFAEQPDDWQTWREQRGPGSDPADEQAARQAAAHADTPATGYLDAAGRAFLTVARDGSGDELATRVDLDVEGRELSLRDAVAQPGAPLGRVIARYAYDLLGNRIHEATMDSGESRTLLDVLGNTLYAWDARGHVAHASFDHARRLVGTSVRGTTAESDPRLREKEVLVERVEFGELADDPESLNLRTRVLRRSDSSGTVTFARLTSGGEPVAAYDFKGNTLHTTRRLVSDFSVVPDWSADVALDPEAFVSSTVYDAMNRPVQSSAPHREGARVNVLQPAYGQAGLLERLDVWLGRDEEPATLLDSADEAPSAVGIEAAEYDAKGQRVSVTYKNGVTTSRAYDPQTFRLVALTTRRSPPGGTQLQALRYTYDAVGNVTRVRDDAQQVVYFDNQVVEPGSSFVYDAHYRLIEATGREHLGQLDDGRRPGPHPPDSLDSARVGLTLPGDGPAMARYVERYAYDAVGNLTVLRHQGSNAEHPGWTQDYVYEEPSVLGSGGADDGVISGNRLTSTALRSRRARRSTPAAYTYDRHGNMTGLPGLGAGDGEPVLTWDHDDRLARVDLGGGGVAAYVYDASGQRVRKVWVKSSSLTEERTYLGATEIHRRLAGPSGEVVLERETLNVHDGVETIAVVETRTLDVTGRDRAPGRLVRYQLRDVLGSTSTELDEQARVISYEEYTPYGSSSFQALSTGTETPKRFRFTGKERDEETGLSYFGARYYAPWLARWVSADPMGLVDGPNPYCYARAAPTRLVDPRGLQSAPPPPTYLPRPGGNWDVDADRIVRRRVINGSGPWKAPRATKRAGNRLAEITGFPPEDRHLGHEGKAHWETHGGEETYVRNEPGRGVGNNSSRGASIERARSAAAKARGEYARVDGSDPNPPPGAPRSARAVPHNAPRQHAPAAAPAPAAPAAAAPASAPVAPTVAETPAPAPSAPPATELTAASPAPEPPKVEAPKVDAPQVEAPKVETPGVRGTGAMGKAVGVVGAALLARDLYKAKDNAERGRIVAGAAAGTAGLGAVARIPVAGPWVAAAATGAGIGVGIGTVLAEDVIPDSAQRAYGKVLAEKGFGAKQDDIELLEKFEVLGYRPFKP